MKELPDNSSRIEILLKESPLPNLPNTEDLVTKSRSTQTNRINQSEMQPISSQQIIPLGTNPPNLNDLKIGAPGTT